MTTTCSLPISLSLSLSLSRLTLSLSNFSASNFRVRGNLLKKFQTTPRDKQTILLLPPTTTSHLNKRENQRYFSPHLDKSRHVSTTVGQLTHSRGRVGKKDRIIHQRIKQEKAYRTPLESQQWLPTVGKREKRAAH